MPNSKPNIIFCHIDQMHHLAPSHMGNPFVATPAIDEMAADGYTFQRAISSNPICCPARACWYTGRMSSENGVFTNGVACRADLPDLGQWLGSKGGYDCYYGGKMHIPTRKASDGFKVIYPEFGEGEKSDEALAATGEAFLKNYKGDKPFFLNLGFLNPHDCCYLCQDSSTSTPPAFKAGMEKLLKQADLPPLPPSYDPTLPFYSFEPSQGEHRKDLHWTPDQVRLYLYIYYRMCETVDAAVGRVYRAFKASRFADNTIFIFASDHGDMLTEHNRVGKALPWDAAARVPLIIAGRGIAPGTRDDTHWTHGVDVSATIADYAGAGSLPDASMGRSLKSIMENQGAPWHDYVVSESNAPDPLVTFRRGDMKSVFHLGGKKVEFYDTAKDPYEMSDLAADDANPSGLDDHRAFLKDYQSRVQYLPAYQQAIAAGSFNGGGGI